MNIILLVNDNLKENSKRKNIAFNVMLINLLILGNNAKKILFIYINTVLLFRQLSE